MADNISETEQAELDDGFGDEAPAPGPHPNLSGLSSHTGELAVNGNPNAYNILIDEFGWGEEEVQAVDNPLGHIADEDFEEAAYGEDGFFNRAWIVDQGSIVSLLESVGLTDERLAAQEGEEMPLLQQLLRQLNLELTPAQQSYHLQELIILVRTAISESPRTKRLKGYSLPLPMQRMRDVLETTLKAGKGTGRNSISDLDQQMIIPRKGLRRFSMQAREHPELSREQFDERRRNKCIEDVYRILEKGDVPLLGIAANSQNVLATITGAIGSTRSGTLQTYTKSMQSLIDFLVISKGIHWPSQVTDVTDYLHVRAAEPCTVSVPQVLLQALAWFEKTAMFAPGDKLSSHELVRKTVDYVIEKVSNGAAPLKQAPRLPSVVLASLELYTCNREDNSPGKRLKSFSILLKAYCTMREDDIQHLSPKQIRIMGELLVAELLHTKTTGRTKRVKELPVALWAGTSITGAAWIEEGILLLDNFGNTGRDHILPKMSTDGLTAKEGPLSYAASAALTMVVMSELKRPIFAADQWKEDNERLVHPSMTGFWTEHSPRAVIPSILAVLDVEKTKADYAGRWSPTGSQDYTRTFRTVIKSLQQTVIQAFQEDDRRLEESDIVDRLLRFGKGKGWEEAHLNAVVERFRNEGLRFQRLLQSREYKEWRDEASGAIPCINVTSQDVPLSTLIPVSTQLPSKQKRFLIVFTRNKHFARLHRIINSNCPWVRNQVKDCIELDTVEPNLYNARCRICWPEVAAQGDEDESDSSLSEE